MPHKKAFLVRDDEGGCDILFAESLEDLVNDNSDFVEGEHFPEYDRYSSLGYVPPLIALIREDFSYYQCWECEAEINCWQGKEEEAFFYESRFTDDDEEHVELNPIGVKDKLFCSKTCLDYWREGIRKRKEQHEENKNYLLNKFPGITELDVVVNGTDYAIADFRFPGGQYKVNWKKSDSNHVYVHPDDQEAWHKFAESIKEEKANLA